MAVLDELEALLLPRVPCPIVVLVHQKFIPWHNLLVVVFLFWWLNFIDEFCIFSRYISNCQSWSSIRCVESFDTFLPIIEF